MYESTNYVFEQIEQRKVEKDNNQRLSIGDDGGILNLYDRLLTVAHSYRDIKNESDLTLKLSTPQKSEQIST